MDLGIMKLKSNAWIIQLFANNYPIKVIFGMILLNHAYNVSIIAPLALLKLHVLLALKVIV